MFISVSISIITDLSIVTKFLLLKVQLDLFQICQEFLNFFLFSYFDLFFYVFNYFKYSYLNSICTSSIFFFFLRVSFAFCGTSYLLLKVSHFFLWFKSFDYGVLFTRSYLGEPCEMSFESFFHQETFRYSYSM